ncbi:hypothetical protein H1V43_11365 [Streptomyces sp. PSKA54]|uniref:DUF3558 domain-containing protein n=1 Tax=Streptomyces himalayensis subsp. aureolus TaxID=2758039 RepID=A0A7W2HFM0_9ACTN|nr:hypothetical protein [Streptomyces himalayensis]MBA4861976.1 hypothetical protein [Streptomyces himalayensis subsp. aureolus]
MRTLPLPLTLTARLLPVALLAITGWAWTSGPGASPAGHTESPSGGGATPSASATAVAVQTHRKPPEPCDSISDKTLKSLVPGAKTAGKELASTDKSVRRTCSWNALKGYDYRWLDVTFEIKDDDAAAEKAYKDRIAEKSGGGAVPGLGDTAYSVVNLTTEDKQETREGVVIARASNALVIVTYNGSDFETKKAPSTDEINKGAIKAAKEAVAALEDGQ